MLELPNIQSEMRSLELRCRFHALVVTFLLIATISIYWQAHDYQFVDFDDREYVSDNVTVQNGLTAEGFAWAFTAAHSANWHPLTWLTHMLDVQLFGMAAGMHHLSNLLYHLINAFLLYLVLNRMTGAIWKSAFVAAVFALHPMNAETVLWISQRKTLLGTLFWMLTLWYYTGYVKKRFRRDYLLALLFYIMGLLLKPMLVTLPFALLLLDYWPLSRMEKEGLLPLLLEKLPLFGLSAISSVLTFFVQQSAGAVAQLSLYTISMRFQNALVAYVGYIKNMLWPVNLSAYYPYPESFSLWQTGMASLILVCMTAFAVREWRRRPWIIVGWLWFLGNLFPMIGIVQVGSQSMADRYFYVSGIGLFLILSWTVSGLLTGKVKEIILAGISFAVISAVMTVSWAQAHHWENSRTLYHRIITVSPGSDMGYFGLGVALAERGKYEASIPFYREALRLNPEHVRAKLNLGAALMEAGHLSEALHHFKSLLSKMPNNAELRNNLGITFSKMGRARKSVVQFRHALRIDSNNAQVLNNLGVVLFRLGQHDEALACFKLAIRLDPGFEEARKNIRKALKSNKKTS